MTLAVSLLLVVGCLCATVRGEEWDAEYLVASAADGFDDEEPNFHAIHQIADLNVCPTADFLFLF